MTDRARNKKPQHREFKAIWIKSYTIYILNLSCPTRIDILSARYCLPDRTKWRKSSRSFAYISTLTGFVCAMCWFTSNSDMLMIRRVDATGWMECGCCCWCFDWNGAHGPRNENNPNHQIHIFGAQYFYTELGWLLYTWANRSHDGARVECWLKWASHDCVFVCVYCASQLLNCGSNACHYTCESMTVFDNLVKQTHTHTSCWWQWIAFRSHMLEQSQRSA